MQSKIFLPSLFTAAGFIPFIAGAVAISLELDLKHTSSEALTLAYSSVIFAFISGTLWSKGLESDAVKLPLLGLSNLFALFAWFCWAQERIHIAFGLLAIGYIAMHIAERKLSGFSASYLRMRLLATICIVVIHGVIFMEVRT